MSQRGHNVMLRLTADEHAALAAAAGGVPVAAYARLVLLEALGGRAAADPRRVAAFVVAALSPNIDFAAALDLFDAHVPSTPDAGGSRGRD